MKIGLVRRGFSATGGAEAYLLRLAAGLAEAGHETGLVTSGHWPDSAWPYGGILRLPGGTPSAFASAFRAAKDRFDVTLSLDRTPGCDVFRAGDGVHAAWLRRRAAYEPWLRCLFRRWNPKHGALVLLERMVFEEARAIIANSRMVADEIKSYYDLPAGRVKVVYNGIGAAIPAVPRADARAALGIPDRIFCALFVGTGWERKGLATAVAAIDRLDDGLLLVAGDGPASAYRGRCGRVRFLGPTRELGAPFSAADVFVLPTNYDPFSNACLEALSAGLPVVTTTANGCAEILEPGVHGSVVPPRDPAATAAALAEWARRPPATEACRRLAAEFSITRNVRETVAILEQAKGPDT